MKTIVVRWIPGYAQAITLPPLGIFIERAHFKNRKLLRHERGHWKQYEELGFWRFYYTVLRQYWRYGPRKAPIEAQATALGADEPGGKYYNPKDGGE